MHETKEAAIEALRQGKKFGYYTFKNFRDDEDVVREAIRLGGHLNLKFASPRLKDKKDFVMWAVQIDGFALRYVSIRLQNDREVVLRSIQKDCHAFCFAHRHMNDHKDIVLTAVRGYGFFLDVASDRLKDDNEVVLTAVQSYELALKFASERLRKDKAFLLSILSRESSDSSRYKIVQYASEDIKALIQDEDPIAALSNAIAVEGRYRALLAELGKKSERKTLPKI